ncbi:hypothetical protein [Plantactinospora sp. GCM10030261]|uniref:hypothetical protein n=1 Tax=Plantactinospora sp. GCM10030261 TaxID=3273420 RepID=UPI0036106DB1
MSTIDDIPVRSRSSHPRRPVLVGVVVGLCAALAAAAGHLIAPTGEPPSTNLSTQPAPTAVPSPPAAATPNLVPPTPITYWPSASTTGVPAGTVLRNSSGLTLRTAGQVVTGLNIVGCVTVAASNVRITRSRITCNSIAYSVRVLTGFRNLVLEDVEITGSGVTSAAVCCSDFTIRRANIHRVIDGPRMGSNTTIVDSYLHDLSRQTGTHNDSLQTTGGSNILIQHNRIDTYNATLRDPMNACLMLGSSSGRVTNLLMTDNYCNGGNYSIGISPTLAATNVRFTRNKFGRDYRYGVCARPTQPGVFWERSTNVWFDTGLPVIP